MRYGLMMTAVATVTVPGLIAVLGVVGYGVTGQLRGGQASAGTQAGAGTAAGTGTPAGGVSGPFPMAPSTARAVVRNEATGLRLLDQAASAGQQTSYQGTEQISQAGVDGSVTELSRVWHLGNGGTLVAAASGPAAAAAGTVTQAASPAAASGAPEGVFGVTKPLVTQLGQHYVTVYRGSGTVTGRAAVVVELYRYDGSLAARYWLDQQTMLPLRRALFDSAGHLISQDLFTQVKFGVAGGQAAVQAEAASQAQARAQAQQPSWTAAASAGQFRASLSAAGWPAPAVLPGGLPLYAAASMQTGSGKVVDLEYSDGLYVVSLFVQRGELPADLTGWQPVTVAGQQAYAAGHSLTWARLGFVYTMIADAPAGTVRQVVGALPASDSSGLLGRLGRGLERLARMANPFG